MAPEIEFYSEEDLAELAGYWAGKTIFDNPEEKQELALWLHYIRGEEPHADIKVIRNLTRNE